VLSPLRQQIDVASEFLNFDDGRLGLNKMMGLRCVDEKYLLMMNLENELAILRSPISAKLAVCDKGPKAKVTWREPNILNLVVPPLT